MRAPDNKVNGETMIPDSKQPAVTRALHEAFGMNEYEELHLLSGGLSTALAFKIVVRKNPYLLKILRTEIISDPAHEFACMQTAAEAGHCSPHLVCKRGRPNSDHRFCGSKALS